MNFWNAATAIIGILVLTGVISIVFGHLGTWLHFTKVIQTTHSRNTPPG
jgi:uncharacterized membrane protein YkgB